MSFVYLIEERNGQGYYKIGSTRNKDIQKRLKQLQTGNADDLVLKDCFETEKPFKLEKMLHNKYQDKRLDGEWFLLDEDDVSSFQDTCQKYQDIIDSLKDNPYF